MPGVRVCRVREMNASAVTTSDDFSSAVRNPRRATSRSPSNRASQPDTTSSSLAAALHGGASRARNVTGANPPPRQGSRVGAPLRVGDPGAMTGNEPLGLGGRASCASARMRSGSAAATASVLSSAAVTCVATGQRARGVAAGQRGGRGAQGRARAAGAPGTPPGARHAPPALRPHAPPRRRIRSRPAPCCRSVAVRSARATPRAVLPSQFESRARLGPAPPPPAGSHGCDRRQRGPHAVALRR